MKKDSPEETKQFWTIAIVGVTIGVLIKIFIINEYAVDLIKFILSKFQ